MRWRSRELGSRKITVNLVRPGQTNTDTNPADGELASMVTNTIPVGRYGRPEEIAKAVAILAGPDAAFITGTGITADGGSIA
ncbi:SDR family oxidoreductase [uncultured Brevundimonas sp.]|uniref:SDR family oxidoreductase n=1 Tax=uncultured Brevundimonas sp. TaxID=213418 RepID=UPI00263457DF|nr:SDR family oxidoreductase [uncultured Brevundimonas sp.]